MCVCLSVYLCTMWGQEPTQVRRGIMSLGLELQVVMNHHAVARNWTQVLCKNNEYEYIYEFERNFMSLAKGSFCKSKNQGISISWMVFKYLHMCECMYMYVCICMYVQKVHSCSKDRARVLWGNELQSFITPVFLGFQGACFHSILFPCCIRFLC